MMVPGAAADSLFRYSQRHVPLNRHWEKDSRLKNKQTNKDVPTAIDRSNRTENISTQTRTLSIRLSI